MIQQAVNTTQTNQKPELIPVSKWNDYFDYPTLGALRQLIFYQNTNGFSKVLRKMGKTRLYIKTSAFFLVIEPFLSIYSRIKFTSLFVFFTF